MHLNHTSTTLTAALVGFSFLLSRPAEASQPMKPKQLGACTLPGRSPGAVQCDGKLVFATNWNANADTQQLQIFDISNPALPQRLGFFRTRGHAFKIAATGHWVFAEVHDNGTQEIVMLFDRTNTE
ncbi:LVIVD repeat-containing protein [Novipirellula artificiosorum]|uniref:LVIVD repeat protein n=1 Tax=Novipirellula artificiosorum TaxID=2528016 RepID=A0A5C6D858_9BACT|nr:hypothetical protein [Novipirellula artificiosorum]TWU33363.1 hypothetical protein Poly41_51170 [Novipirellula artificiosorum]